MLVNMTDWIEEHYKTNTERYVQRLAVLLDLAGVSLSFGQIIQYLPTDKFMTLSATLLKDNKITKAQHTENREIAETSGKIAENASARFSTVAESEIGAVFHGDGCGHIYGTSRKLNHAVCAEVLALADAFKLILLYFVYFIL